MRAQLIPIGGGTSFEITKDITLVGRKEDCDFRLDHKSVSKIHCVLVKTDGLILLRDLGSTNGTRVNGQRVRRAALLPDDQLTIAGFGFKVTMGPGDPPASPFEATMQLEAEEVAELMEKASKAQLEDSGKFAAPNGPLKINALPDVYPQDEKPEEP